MQTNDYTANGYANRRAYLDSLAEDFGPAVYALAFILGPSEDFDGLVTSLEDMDEDEELY